MAKKLTSSKAREILHDKSVHGHPLTDKQRKFFGAIAGGAKPYKAESGGWLDQYEQGGLILKKKTKDNFGKKANPNDVQAKTGPGYVGLAYDTTGRNYSPAWGGQFQDGGKLTFLEPTSRKLPMGHVIPMSNPSTELAISVGGEGGEPAYLIPSFKYGKYLTDKDAKAEFRKTGEHLGGPFKTWQEADEWERTVRHPYVEKGQNIPTPLRRWGKDFAMGGALPGAVGFTYARTINPAPSNGKYAKKTQASAQNGQEMKYYQDGLDFKPKTISQNGSEIPVDPMGYWNPENVGNPVIIPSTDITMEGVDQDLIGISDTGDVQYMQPGEDYSFDGEYVTEYPVMQQGGRTPLYVSDPNDPRLKSYSDSLYNYNLGQKLVGVLANNKAYSKVLPGSPLDRKVQAAVAGQKGKGLIDNTANVKNKQIKALMTDYQERANKGMQPIRYQGFIPNLDNAVLDLISGRSFLENIGVMKPKAEGNFYLPQWKKPEQEVILDASKAPKPKEKPDKYGLTTEDYVKIFSANGKGWTATPGQHADGYYRYKKGNTSYKIYTGSGGFSHAEIEKPAVKKQEPKKQEVVKKQEPVTPIVERIQNVYEGTPVYARDVLKGPFIEQPGGWLMGFVNQKGDTTYIKPEDYERFAVPKYGKEYIERKKQNSGGWLNKYK